MVFFDDVSGPDCSDSKAEKCLSNVRPFGRFEGDLRSGDIGRYNFITPDLCNATHDDCTGDAIRQGDDWLNVQIPIIMASEAYRTGGVIFITWDEGGVGNEPIGLVAISAFARPGPTDCEGASHVSLLRTTQTMLGVGPYLLGAADAPDLSKLFTRGP